MKILQSAFFGAVLVLLNQAGDGFTALSKCTRLHRSATRLRVKGPTLGEALESLGLERGASVEEAKRAYRKAAMRCHPDRNSTEAAAAEFIEISTAYARIVGKQSDFGSQPGDGSELSDLAYATLDLAWAVAFASKVVIDDVAVPFARDLAVPLATEIAKDGVIPFFRSAMAQGKAVMEGSSREDAVLAVAIGEAQRRLREAEVEAAATVEKRRAFDAAHNQKPLLARAEAANAALNESTRIMHAKVVEASATYNATLVEEKDLIVQLDAVQSSSDQLLRDLRAGGVAAPDLSCVWGASDQRRNELEESSGGGGGGGVVCVQPSALQQRLLSLQASQSALNSLSRMMNWETADAVVDMGEEQNNGNEDEEVRSGGRWRRFLGIGRWQFPLAAVTDFVHPVTSATEAIQADLDTAEAACRALSTRRAAAAAAQAAAEEDLNDALKVLAEGEAAVERLQKVVADEESIRGTLKNAEEKASVKVKKRSLDLEEIEQRQQQRSSSEEVFDSSAATTTTTAASSTSAQKVAATTAVLKTNVTANVTNASGTFGNEHDRNNTDDRTVKSAESELEVLGSPKEDGDPESLLETDVQKSAVEEETPLKTQKKSSERDGQDNGRRGKKKMKRSKWAEKKANTKKRADDGSGGENDDSRVIPRSKLSTPASRAKFTKLSMFPSVNGNNAAAKISSDEEC